MHLINHKCLCLYTSVFLINLLILALLCFFFSFHNIVFPALNSTSTKIRSEAARLLGSAVQNNIKVQISALENGTVGILLRMLALDSSPEVQSSVFYALSCLVRKFPAAQQAFVNEGGVTVLSSLFSGESSNQLKLQVNVCILMTIKL